MSFNSETKNDCFPKIWKGNNSKLLDTLFEKFKKTKNGIAKRIRARAIFSEIDKFSTQDFKKLIKMSRERFTHIKAGNNMNKEIIRSTKQYRNLASKLYEKEMYNNSTELNNDKKGLKLKRYDKDNDEISDLFKTLKGTFYPSKSCLNLKSNYAQETEKIFKTKSNECNQISNNPNQTLFKSKSQFDIIREHKDYLNEYFEKERELLYNNLNEYTKITSKLGSKETAQSEPKNPFKQLTSVEKTEGDKSQKKTEKNEFQINTLSFLHKLNLLHYKKPAPQVKIIKKQEKPEFNITKLMRYTRSTSFLEQNNIKSEKEPFRSSNVSIEKIQENDINTIDYSDTINLVKREIGEEEKIKESFKERLKNLNSLMNFSLPSVEEYNSIIKKAQRNRQLAKINKKTKEQLKREKEIENETPFYRSLSEIFNRKKQLWELEEEKEKEKSKSEKEIKEKCIKFLNELNQVKRKVFTYNDPYSIREGTVNKCLNDISIILGKKLFTKEEMKEQAENYYNFIAEKEKREKKEIIENYKKQLDINEQIRSSEKKYSIYEKGIDNLDYLDTKNAINEGEEIDFVSSYKDDSYSKRIRQKQENQDSNNHNSNYEEFLHTRKIYQNKLNEKCK